jgi:hypothetical protein
MTSHYVHLESHDADIRATYYPNERFTPYISIAADGVDSASTLFLSIDQAATLRDALNVVLEAAADG